MATVFAPCTAWSQTGPDSTPTNVKLNLNLQNFPAGTLVKDWSTRISAPVFGLIGDESWLVAYSKLDSTLCSISPADGKIRWQSRPFLGALSAPVRWNSQLLVLPNSSSIQGLDELTGEVAWRIPFVSKSVRDLETGPSYSGFNAPLTSPSELLWLETSGQLWSLNGDHQLRVVGNFRQSSTDSSRFLGQPTISNGLLVACSQRGTLTSVNLKNGTPSLLGSLRSQVTGLSGKLSVTTSPISVGSRLILASEDGTVFGYWPGFKNQSWVRTFGLGTETFSVAGELLFRPLVLRVVESEKNPGIVVALRHRIERLNSDKGDRIWSIGLKDSLLYPPSLGPNQSIVVTTSEELLILNWDGAIVQRAPITNGLAAPALLVDGAIILAYKDGRICRYHFR